MDKITLNTFPRNSCEALTMLYIQQLDLNGKSPEELVQIYNDIYSRISAEQSKIASEISNSALKAFLDM